MGRTTRMRTMSAVTRTAIAAVVALTLSACGSSDDAQVVVERDQIADPAARLAAATFECGEGMEMVGTMNGEPAMRASLQDGRGVGEVNPAAMTSVMGAAFGGAAADPVELVSTAFDTNTVYLRVEEEWFSASLDDDGMISTPTQSIDVCGTGVNDMIRIDGGGTPHTDPDNPDALVIALPSMDESMAAFEAMFDEGGIFAEDSEAPTEASTTTAPSELTADEIRAVRDGDSRVVVTFDSSGRVVGFDQRMHLGGFASMTGMPPTMELVVTFSYSSQSIELPTAVTEVSRSEISAKMLQLLISGNPALFGDFDYEQFLDGYDLSEPVDGDELAEFEALFGSEIPGGN